MLGLKPDDGGTGTGTAPPEKRKASPRPPARGQQLPLPHRKPHAEAAPELSKGPLVGGRSALFQKCDLFQKSGFCSKSPNEAAKISVAVPDCHLVQGSAYSRIFQQNGVLVPVQFSP